MLSYGSDQIHRMHVIGSDLRIYARSRNGVVLTTSRTSVHVWSRHTFRRFPG
jgi:hypothetical protein